MPLRIEELSDHPRDRKRFLEVEFRLNRDDPLWVPPLRFDRLRTFDPARNPFFRHARAAHFVAVRDGRDAGRVAAVRNELEVEVRGEPVGSFGFFECEDDPEAARALLDAAADWAARQGLTLLRGPLSYDVNGLTGALVGPFDRPPLLLMPHNRPYLPALIEGAGFAKCMDVLAYDLWNTDVPERLRRLTDRLKEREGIAIRGFRRDRFDEEIHLLKDLYNRAWEANWGFVPMTDAEIDAMAADLKAIFDPNLLCYAEVGGRPVGFCLVLPDLNEILIRIRNGRLLPFGLFRLLFGRRRITRTRVLTLGVLPEYRRRGVEALFYREAFERAGRGGYHRGAECSWILEENEPMRKGLEAIGAELGRRYRIYERRLAAPAP